ncbi:hypothetical protein CAPTEDRAFT_222046 [Capitella teleta]|uniref:valine--tRNA ligase n=1 Tax=Capitella teleta TaxID=283909 RepID=R7TCM8_CAPTE|nr:hypothetical protein CAPTEDRAFT_222046 [Capitella teleta]|eukprot:ELT91479.1 hypothetical protein CAPTEDRAFT_222046 [Capitella teleta]
MYLPSGVIKFHRLCSFSNYINVPKWCNYSSQARREQKKLRKEVKQALVSGKNKESKKSFQEVLYEGNTAPGQKKDVSIALPSTYSPRFVEAAWYDWWEKEGFFLPDHESKDSFVVCLPPPNVTGSLHLGHALGNSIQDAICRWHRMHGKSVLWNPGCDHAGIATQVVVEKQLWKEKKLTRHQLGREQFVEEVWKWKEEKGDRIFSQMKKLGSSLDWNRSCFTLDQKLTDAVTEAFVRLHDDGIIYRSNRLVNWSCTLKSAISDIEVDNLSLDGETKLSVPGYERKIPFGQMVTFAYPIQGSSDTISVATTRIETMLGDTGIAIHPDDTRFTHLHGRVAVHPLTGRLLPIVCDSHVQQDLGTGAVKLTPAHDHNDFELGMKHRLESLSILDDAGCLVNVPEEFLGMPRFSARYAVTKALKEHSLYRGTSSHAMVVPVCSRSGDIIEPRLKPQWYVNCQDMAKYAIKAVKSGELELIPSNYERQWMEWRVAMTMISGLAEGILTKLLKRLVLNLAYQLMLSFFSKTEDLQRFFPTSLLETASDIMFFWVARMVMMSHVLTEQLPFKQVLFHSVLRDAHGRKMSKSLGNVIDPMDVISGISLEGLNQRLKDGNLDPKEVQLAEKAQRKDFPQGIPECGADALRFSLCSYNHKANFVNVDINHIQFHRKFCNKIWQAYKFVFPHLRAEFNPSVPYELSGYESATDVWMLSRLAHLVQACDMAFTDYDLNNATTALIDFWWSEFCDIYLEYSKEVFRSGSPEAVSSVQCVMHACVDNGIRALSPFMPYLCEELFQRLPKRSAGSVCVAAYPRVEELAHCVNAISQTEMQHVKDVFSVALKMRRDLHLTKTKAHVYIQPCNADVEEALLKHHTAFLVLSRSAEVHILSERSFPPNGCIYDSTEQGNVVYMQVQDLINVEEELNKLEKQREKQNVALHKISVKSSQDAQFSIEEEKMKEIQLQLKSTDRIIASLKRLLPE